MSTPRPLSYDSSKYVMRYFDPNLRSIISQRCPSLAIIEKITPTRVHTLQFQPNSFMINGTTYIVGVIQVYKNKRTPKSILAQNVKGGVTTDVDRYGIELTEVGDGQRLVQQYEEMKQMCVKQRDKLKMHSQTPDGWRRVQRLNERIEMYELTILPYTLRQENTEPPFAHYLQIMVKSDNGVKSEQLNYARTIPEAKEYLLNKLLGGDRRTIEVFKLNIGGTQRFRGFNGRPLENFPLPSPFLPLASEKLEVQHMEIMVDMNKALNSLKPILWDQPLKSLVTIGQNISVEQRQEPLIASANWLSIDGDSPVGSLSWYSNERIHLESCTFDNEEVKNLITEWQRLGVKIGKRYSIGFKREQSIQNFLNAFKAVPGSEIGEVSEIRHTTFNECVIVPIREYSELNVYCEETPKEDQKYCGEEYIVKINVQPRGFAVNLYL